MRNIVELPALAIAKVVAAEYGITATQLLGRCREMPLCEARQVVMLILREDWRCSTNRIATELDRNRSTVVLGLRHIRNLASVDKSVRRHISNIRDALGSMAA